jgi:hypothetical protein
VLKVRGPISRNNPVTMGAIMQKTLCRSFVAMSVTVAALSTAPLIAGSDITASALRIDANAFMGLRLGSTLDDVKRDGGKYFVNRPGENFGPYVEVGSLPQEFPGTKARRLYFKDDYGLYRVVFEIGSVDGRRLSPDDAAKTYQSLTRTLIFANDIDDRLQSHGAARFIRAQFPDVKKLDLGELRACPDGRGKFKADLNSSSIPEIRQFLVGLGSTPDHSASVAALYVAAHCGVLDSPEFEVGLGSDIRVSVGVDLSNLPDEGPELFVTFRNDTIARMMVK